MATEVNKSFVIENGTLNPRLVSAQEFDLSQGMVWYVDIEHDQAIADPARKEGFDAVRYDRAMMCSRASGLSCEALHYHDATSENASQKNVRAMCISGNTTDWVHYDFQSFEPLFSLIRSGMMPTLALCGGHQLIALAYGAQCEAIRKLEAGEPEIVAWAAGYFAEVGFLPVALAKADPLFDGLGEQAIFFESHYWEIKELPEAFELLASTPSVMNQVIKLRKYPVYGTQFHPEVNDAKHPDGFQLMKNFFRIAGIQV